MRWTCLLILALVGCSAQKPTEPNPIGPVLIHLPGMAGIQYMDRAWTSSLKDAGLVVTFELYEWTDDEYRNIDALQAVDRNRAEAAKLADRITHLARSDPHRRIILTSQSAGSGFAVFALEKLPGDVQIDTLVMLAPALSPDYDLTAALRHVRRDAYVFTSPHDRIILGMGTRTFGTVDGPRVEGAGLVGFKRPASGDPMQYAKLVDLQYSAAWMRFSNFGDHTGALSSSFAANIIGPLLITGMLPQ